jgi:hypothetical protein
MSPWISSTESRTTRLNSVSGTVNSLLRKARLARIRELDGVDGRQRAGSVVRVLLVLVETISMAIVIRLVTVGGGSRNDSG